MESRDHNYVESEAGGDDASDDVFKHAQVSLEFELKRRKVQSEDDVQIYKTSSRARVIIAYY